MSRPSWLTFIITAILAVFIGAFGLSALNTAEAGGCCENLSVEIVAPEQVLVGQKFDVKVIVSNTFPQIIRFSGMVFLDGAAATPHDGNPVVSTGEAIRIPELDGWRFFWNGGIVRDGEKVTLTLPMTAKKMGKYDFARVRLIASTLQEIYTTQKTLTVVEPPAPKPVIFQINPTSTTVEVEKTAEISLVVDSQSEKTASLAFASIQFDAQKVEVVDMDTKTPGIQGLTTCGTAGLVRNELRYTWNGAGMAISCKATWRIKGKAEGNTQLSFVNGTPKAVTFEGQNFPIKASGGQITVTAHKQAVTANLKAQNRAWLREGWQILNLDISSSVPISRYNVETTCPSNISTSASAPMAGYPNTTEVHKQFSVYVLGNARRGGCSFILRGNLVDGTPLPYARADVTIK